MGFSTRVEHLVGLVVSDAVLRICIELQVLRFVNKYYHCQAPTHFLWLLLCFLSHSYLNFCAELLRFGDRHFYGDWWSVALKHLRHRFFHQCQHCFTDPVFCLFCFCIGMLRLWFLSGRTGASLARSGVTGVAKWQRLNWSQLLVLCKGNKHSLTALLCLPCLCHSREDTCTAGWWRIMWLQYAQSCWSSWCLLLFLRYKGKIDAYCYWTYDKWNNVLFLLASVTLQCLKRNKVFSDVVIPSCVINDWAQTSCVKIDMLMMGWGECNVLCSTQCLFALPLHSCRLWIFFMMVFEVRATNKYLLNTYLHQKFL